MQRTDTDRTSSAQYNNTPPDVHPFDNSVKPVEETWIKIADKSEERWDTMQSDMVLYQSYESSLVRKETPQSDTNNQTFGKSKSG